MAVLIEGVSVVVRRDAVRLRYVGGEEAFITMVPGTPSCRDEDLYSMGFMDSDDARAYWYSLVDRGLHAGGENGEGSDLLVVIQGVGKARAADWLEYGEVDSQGRKLHACWLAGKEPSNMAVPRGWTWERSLTRQGSGPMKKREPSSSEKLLRVENGVEVYWDAERNREVYKGRAVVPGDSPEAIMTQLQRVFHDTVAVEKGGAVKKPWLWGKGDGRYRKLERELLPAANGIVGGAGREMWFAHFVRGVVLRVMGDRENAVKAFLRGRELNGRAVPVLKDLVRCLGEMGRVRESLGYAREAVEVEASAATLGNLAASLMDCGEYDEALEVVDRAVAMDAGDEINQALRREILRRKPVG